MSVAAISVEGLSKVYHIGLKQDRADTLTGAVQNLVRKPLAHWRHMRRMNTFKHQEDAEDVYWALRDVSFEVAEGEVVGIIGRNGAGKSTLLKILSRVTEPTSGRAVIRGRVSSLLEVGTGFHQELSGRENVYMNGTILGMTKREIDRKFDEIVDFSGVEKFLDTPIKHYSSGMKVRLAFSVAAHLEPEILIIDEVLAVGDAEFQKKCLGKMQDVACGGRTVLFVSHNMPSVRTLTTRCAFLEYGKLIAAGQTEEIIDLYLSRSLSIALDKGIASLDYFRRNINPTSPVRFRRIDFQSQSDGDVCYQAVNSGDPITIDFEIECETKLPETCFSLTLIRNQEHTAVTVFSGDSGFRVPLSSGIQTIRCTIDKLPLAPGRYSINCGINKNANAIAYDVLLDFPAFEIKHPNVDSGRIDWPHRPWGAVHWEDVTWQVQ